MGQSTHGKSLAGFGRWQSHLCRLLNGTAKTFGRKPCGGRHPTNPRKVLEGMFCVMCAGTQRKVLPKEFGSSSSAHRYFRWSILHARSQLQRKARSGKHLSRNWRPRKAGRACICGDWGQGGRGSAACGHF